MNEKIANDVLQKVKIAFKNSFKSSNKIYGANCDDPAKREAGLTRAWTAKTLIDSLRRQLEGIPIVVAGM